MSDNQLSKKDIDRPDDQPSKKNSVERSSLRWLSYGIEFAGVLGIFTYAGYWADQRFGSEPWLTVSGLLFGFIGMFYLLIKETAKWRK